VLDKAEYSALESTLNSSIVSYRIHSFIHVYKYVYGIYTIRVFCSAQSENTPPPVQQCHTYFAYNSTGTRVPDKLPGRVPG